jgi:hypothetical protein
MSQQTSPSQFKHPTLDEYLSRGKEWYRAYTAVNGAHSLQPWDAIARELTQEHKMVSAMDPTKRGVYWFEKAKKNHLILSAMKERLDRMSTVAKTRELVGGSLRDAKEQEAHARRNSRR